MHTQTCSLLSELDSEGALNLHSKNIEDKKIERTHAKRQRGLSRVLRIRARYTCTDVHSQTCSFRQLFGT